MNANTRRLRAIQRQLGRETRARHRAELLVATGRPQTIRTHLLAAGLDTTTAGRYASAFSRGVDSDTSTTVTIRPHAGSRRALKVPAKTITRDAFTARLAVYRPAKNPAAANLFTRAALALAA